MRRCVRLCTCGRDRRITPRQFQGSEGVEDWGMLFGRRVRRLPNGFVAAGVGLVDVIGMLPDALNHHPDVDVRRRA